MNPTPLCVLLVEDSDDDAWLALDALRRHGYAPDYRHVMTAADFRAALEEREWDIILCDYAMPGFDAPAALEILRDSDVDVPFIIISGTIGEEVAVDALKRGASDYLLKQSLTRLGAAVERELRNTAERRRADERLRANERLLGIAGRIAHLGGWVVELSENRVVWSDEVAAIHEEPPGTSPTVEEGIRYYAPEFRERIKTVFTACAEHGIPYDEQLQIITAKGRRVWVRAIGQAVRDAAGKIVRVQGAFQDISERLALEEQVRRSQRLEAIGQLTGGLAHDFNNLLTVIIGNTELLGERLAEQPELLELSSMACTAAQRGAELTRRLLAFARRQPLDPKSVDINRLIIGMDGLLRRTLSEDIDIRLATIAEPWIAYVDPAQLEAALLNLAINARDAMPEGGRLTIETANVELDEDYADRHVDLAPGEYVMLALSDTGTGIAPEHLERVFEPFYTTKAAGKGTGLGLSMVYGFVRQSRGHIKIYSETGLGTTVKLYLPRAERVEQATGEPQPQRAETPGSATILVVEDDDLVRSHVEAQLKLLGYLVITARNGPEALEIIRSEADIDLLFTDVIMPGGMNGRELTEAAAVLRPELKVLYTSGYTENAIIHHGRLDDGVDLLQKPYRRIELANKVREVLTR